jgi:hypothetical protein
VAIHDGSRVLPLASPSGFVEDTTAAATSISSHLRPQWGRRRQEQRRPSARTGPQQPHRRRVAEDMRAEEASTGGGQAEQEHRLPQRLGGAPSTVWSCGPVADPQGGGRRWSATSSSSYHASASTPTTSPAGSLPTLSRFLCTGDLSWSSGGEGRRRRGGRGDGAAWDDVRGAEAGVPGEALSRTTSRHGRWDPRIGEADRDYRCTKM